MDEFEKQNAAIVSMDEYRVFHPRLDDILKRLETNPEIFNLITLDFAYRIEEAVLAKAMEGSYNIIYEVSLNTPDAIIDVIKKAKKKKYYTKLRAMAVDNLMM